MAAPAITTANFVIVMGEATGIAAGRWPARVDPPSSCLHGSNKALTIVP
jgi:hypothetical protein